MLAHHPDRPRHCGAGPAVVGVLLLLLALLALAPGNTDAQSKDIVTIVFTYGSEKVKWIKDLTAKFNTDPTHRLADGRHIHSEHRTRCA
jgi:hypothetical protein